MKLSIQEIKNIEVKNADIAEDISKEEIYSIAKEANKKQKKQKELAKDQELLIESKNFLKEKGWLDATTQDLFAELSATERLWKQRDQINTASFEVLTTNLSQAKNKQQKTQHQLWALLGEVA